jgi:hypothetical protein
MQHERLRNLPPKRERWLEKPDPPCPQEHAIVGLFFIHVANTPIVTGVVIRMT